MQAGPQTLLADPQTDVRTEFLPILQDFVPCRGRCPATLCDFTTSKKQGKGTADFMMPFGVLLDLDFGFGPLSLQLISLYCLSQSNLLKFTASSKFMCTQDLWLTALEALICFVNKSNRMMRKDRIWRQRGRTDRQLPKKSFLSETRSFF